MWSRQQCIKSVLVPWRRRSLTRRKRPGGRPRLGDLRSHITCVLCAGYFIDATTIVECLHTFCRSCILCHLESSSCCPVCATTIHRTKGSSSLRADATLQTLVYKMVPDLFSQEMQQRRDFYEEKPYADPELPSWAKGDVASYVPHVFTPDEPLQLRLAMFNAESRYVGSRYRCHVGRTSRPSRTVHGLRGTLQ
ncbi:Polycomb complex protein BMI-1-A [Amphibalanus amphitrite]|uniref:Polycomb complex protein BMI-1-A n=1 Tax=Amphibalanus amphitrite TaxID=1232801 RepID=A0A6A4WAW2_AMPAM|nr:Polycomb complex protein BMI-1-A [Amphibalanus amphitrite]